jgi:hypothetical protein
MKFDMRLNVGSNEIDSQRIYQSPRGPRARARIVKCKGDNLIITKDCRVNEGGGRVVLLSSQLAW